MCNSVVYSILTESCNQHNQYENIFITPPKKNSYPLVVIPVSSQTPSPTQPLIYFLFLWICLFRTFLFFFLIFKNFYFYFFWLCSVVVAARGLSLVVASGDYLFVVVRGLLIVVASLVEEHRL